jgi:hypothetical protein
VNPPFLWQHITGHYTNISVTTAGNRVESANGMTADVILKDVRLQDSANSKGTIGSLNAKLSWMSAGIKDTMAANLPGVGSLVTGVSTDPAAGTVVLEAGSNSVTAKPVVANGDLNLEVLDVNGPLLVPGFGAQGGTVDDLARIFGRASRWALPSSSRDVLRAGPDVGALRDAARRGNDAVRGLGA